LDGYDYIYIGVECRTIWFCGTAHSSFDFTGVTGGPIAAGVTIVGSALVFCCKATQVLLPILVFSNSNINHLWIALQSVNSFTDHSQDMTKPTWTSNRNVPHKHITMLELMGPYFGQLIAQALAIISNMHNTSGSRGSQLYTLTPLHETNSQDNLQHLCHTYLSQRDK
jgi:hypothetical protein